jgi:hypothetical protein
MAKVKEVLLGPYSAEVVKSSNNVSLVCPNPVYIVLEDEY